jgi:hypothetical protein
MELASPSRIDTIVGNLIWKAAMLKPAILSLAAIILLTAGAEAGGRDRYAAPPPPAPGAARYYGPVNNYYGPVTVYAAPDGNTYPAYPAAAYPAYGAGYATAPECDANCYGAGYDWSHGYGYSYGDYGAAYPAYGHGYGYPPSNEGARLDPWNGYNGGWGNGYW